MSQHLIANLCEKNLAEGWKKVLGKAFGSRQMDSLSVFLEQEYAAGRTVFPQQENIFRAFSLVDYSDVKVVIVGQDPYHGLGQANGLAFAVNSGVKPPPSLRNILKELVSDVDDGCTQGTTLEGWAQQGVLLLNTVLTVRADEAFSHRGRGWEAFTENVIYALNNHPQPLVFILWGAPAQQKQSLIKDARHLVLKAAHPSPLSAHRGFFGCRHFSLANNFLKQTGRQIRWQQIDTHQKLS